MRRDDQARGKTRACGAERGACATCRVGGAAHRRSFGKHPALSRYAQLQKKYQAILGGREPLVVRMTMGNTAIWHRISADTHESADTLCSRLRAAGGSCLVQRN